MYTAPTTYEGYEPAAMARFDARRTVMNPFKVVYVEHLHSYVLFFGTASSASGGSSRQSLSVRLSARGSAEFEVSESKRWGHIRR